MKKFQTPKIVLSLTLAACMLFAAPTAAASAATNNNASVDTARSTITLVRRTAEITIGVDGKYELLPLLGSAAKDYGFEVVDQKTLRLHTGTDRATGKPIYTKYPITWTAEKPAYATVNSAGVLSANKVCLTNADGYYYRAPITASIPNVTYKNVDGVKLRFDSGIFYQNNVTVVPQEDLLVYYLGVWEEDGRDVDAQHSKDYDNDSYNVKNNLRLMAQNSTAHCFSTAYSLTALTKTNDGTVRAYVKTTDAKAGAHYYILAFDNNDGTNTVTVQARDYCETTYKTMGYYSRSTSPVK